MPYSIEQMNGVDLLRLYDAYEHDRFDGPRQYTHVEVHAEILRRISAAPSAPQAPPDVQRLEGVLREVPPLGPDVAEEFLRRHPDLPSELNQSLAGKLSKDRRNIEPE